MPVDVPVLQPADPFLDMAGEDLRRRIFLTESETGADAVPAAGIHHSRLPRPHRASQAGTPRRYSYLGEVFRQRREGGNEFFQAGIEDLGDPTSPRADARSVADAHALLALALPGQTLTVTLGDQAIFEAVLAALGLPRGWRMRLARAFGSDDAAGRSACRPRQSAAQRFSPAGACRARWSPMAISTRLPPTSPPAWQEAGLSPSAGRTPAEIARRLIEKTELRSVRLSGDAFAALKRFLAIDVPLDAARRRAGRLRRAVRACRSVPRSTISPRAPRRSPAHGLAAGSDPLRRRLRPPARLLHRPGLRDCRRSGDRPLAGGGRYDRLLTLLGAKTPIPGVGFSVWLDRIERAAGGRRMTDHASRFPPRAG